MIELVVLTAALAACGGDPPTAPTTAASTATETPTTVAAQYEATLTVGVSAGPDLDRYGYTDPAFFSEKGALVPAEFVYDGQTYRVGYLEYTPTIDFLSLGIDRQPPEDFTLTVDGEPYEPDDATTGVDSGFYFYQWRSTPLDWAEGDTVAVQITIAEG